MEKDLVSAFAFIAQSKWLSVAMKHHKFYLSFSQGQRLKRCALIQMQLSQPIKVLLFLLNKSKQRRKNTDSYTRNEPCQNLSSQRKKPKPYQLPFFLWGLPSSSF